MSSVFIDTSAFLSLMDGDDAHHPPTAQVWADLLHAESILIVSNYVLVETFALVQNRMGMKAVRCFQEDIAPLLNIQWVTAEIHQSAIGAVLAAGRKKLSLVDCSSFEIMRRAGIRRAFTLDRHFEEQGFSVIPIFKSGNIL